MARRRPFHRTDRLNREVKKLLSLALLQESREAALRHVIITDVSVTRDISLARVYYYLAEGADAEEVQAAIGRAAGFLRSRVGQGVRMRQTPELRFIFDESIAAGQRVEAILSDLGLSAEEE